MFVYKLLLTFLSVLLMSTTAADKTSVTLEVEFGPQTEDVSIQFKSEVVVGQEPEVVLDKQFDDFPEDIYKNTQYVETLEIDENKLYRLEIRQRNEAEGVRKYTLYRGDASERGNLTIMFTDSFVSQFEGNYAIIDNPATLVKTTSRPTPSPTSSQPSFSPSLRPTRMPVDVPVTPENVTPAPITPAPVTTAPITPAPVETRKTKTVLLQVSFDEKTEDVKLLVKTEDSSNTVYFKDFDSFPAEIFRNKRGQVALPVLTDTLYTISVFQRDGASGVKQFSLFNGTTTSPSNLLVQKLDAEGIQETTNNFLVN